MSVLQAQQAGAGVALVATAAAQAASLVPRVAHTAGAPLQVTQQVVRPLHIYVQVLCGNAKTRLLQCCVITQYCNVHNYHYNQNNNSISYQLST